MKHISCCEPVDSGLSQDEILLMPSTKRNWNIPGFHQVLTDWIACQVSEQHRDSDTTLFLSARNHWDHFLQVTTGSKPGSHHTLPQKAPEIGVSHCIDFSPLFFFFTLSVPSSICHGQKPCVFPILRRSRQIRTQVNSTSSGSFGSVWESVITWWNTLLWWLFDTRTHPHRKKGSECNPKAHIWNFT